MNRTFQRLKIMGLLAIGSSLLLIMLSSREAVAQTSSDEPTQRDGEQRRREGDRDRGAGRPLFRSQGEQPGARAKGRQPGFRAQGGQSSGANGRRSDGSSFEMMMRAIPVLNVLDADNDGQISAEEIRNATASLKRLDRNGDGKLTEEELRPPFTRRPGLSPDGGGRPSMDRNAARPASSDRDPATRDQASSDRRSGNPDEMMLRMFRWRDQNGDGKLSGDEIPDPMRDRLEQFDSNDDGSVSRQELEAMMRRMSGGGARRGQRGRDGGEGGTTPGGDLPRRPEAE